MTKKYPEARSIVEVTFLDGEVREYEISAGSGISKYLVQQAAESGILCFIDYKQRASLSIPINNIREWSIREVEFKTEAVNDDFEADIAANE